MLKKIIKVLKSKKGVATSLLEATATIAVGATLAAAAVTVVTDKIQDARIVQAIQDVQGLADAVNTFEKDNLFFPIFESSGNLSATLITSDPNPFTSPSNTNRASVEVEVLMSANGDFPGLFGDATAVAFAAPVLPIINNWLTGSPLGGLNDHVDTFENQLNNNTPKYTVKGAISFDADRGYGGPYLEFLPATDPWGNRYQANVHYLNDKDMTGTNGLVHSFQTIIISAGPNEQIQTNFESQSDSTGKITIKGDDIAYRIR